MSVIFIEELKQKTCQEHGLDFVMEKPIFKTWTIQNYGNESVKRLAIELLTLSTFSGICIRDAQFVQEGIGCESIHNDRHWLQ